MPRHRPDYLSPYRRSTQQHGADFSALLWASPSTQAARFDAFTRLRELNGIHLLDAGCGRADLLPFLLARNIFPSQYTGLEPIPALAAAARETVQSLPIEVVKSREPSPPLHELIEIDFVESPASLDRGADVLLFSGSLNTLDRPTFYATIKNAFNCARRAVLFNFLSSSHLASADWLTWHPPAHVLAFARKLSPHVDSLSDYLDGDFTLALSKDP